MMMVVTLTATPTLTDLVEVERVLPGHRAIESALEEGRPEVPEARLAAASVALANACHTGVHALAAVHVLHRSLSEEEEYEVFVLEGVHEIRCCSRGKKKKP